MIWREPQNHYDDYYSCVFDLTKKSTKFSYFVLKSTIWPAAHCDEIPIAVFQASVLSDTEASEHHEETPDLSDINQDYKLFSISDHQHLFNQKELSDGIRDLNLSK